MCVKSFTCIISFNPKQPCEFQVIVPTSSTWKLRVKRQRVVGPSKKQVVSPQGPQPPRNFGRTVPKCPHTPHLRLLKFLSVTPGKKRLLHSLRRLALTAVLANPAVSVTTALRTQWRVEGACARNKNESWLMFMKSCWAQGQC